MHTAPAVAFADGCLSDAEQHHLDRFERTALDPGRFDHRAHLYVAWLYARLWRGGRLSLPEITARMSNGLTAFADSVGATDKYHATVTAACLHLVAEATTRPPDMDFETWCDAHPQLLSDFRGLLGRYYSDALLTSHAAKAHVVEPDIRPLPGMEPYR